MNKVIVVETIFANRTAEEVERLVTIPLERVLNSLAEVVQIRSASTHGHCRIEVSYVSDPTPEAFRRIESAVLAEWAKFSAPMSVPAVSINTRVLHGN